MNFFLNLIISISIFLFVNYNSFGQNSTAKIIYGQVIDNSTKKPLENVKITFSTTWKGKKGNRVKGKITTTKKNGAFKKKLSRKHNWNLFVTCKGYNEYRIEDVNFHPEELPLTILLIKK